MSFAWNTLDTGSFIISLVFIILAFGALFFTFFKVVKRTFGFIFLSVSFVLVLLAFFFNLYTAMIVIGFLSAPILAVCLFANLGDLRKFIAAPFHKAAGKKANFGIEKIFDSEELYKNIEATVISLSNSRVGALMTFEKNTSLKDFMKNGVPVEAPVSPELLQTIFYPGTRLHDGAVIIHGNMIVAASVFFTPSTKAYAVKYGSRHRAAIGISEVCDAVTVIVSEETGRISFAVNGQLESVEQVNFLRVFKTYMEEKSDEEEKN